jgi:hypothetical protein
LIRLQRISVEPARFVFDREHGVGSQRYLALFRRFKFPGGPTTDARPR